MAMGSAWHGGETDKGWMADQPVATRRSRLQRGSAARRDTEPRGGHLSAEQKSQLPPRAEACATGQRLRMKSYQRCATKDEARVRQKGTLSYVWGPVGSRPPMVRDNRHDTAYILGAICPARGIGAAIITPAANTECITTCTWPRSAPRRPRCCRRTDLGRRRLASERRRTRCSRQYRRPLPPYSPELNPMENV
jgi:hypothetical protein